MNTAKIQNSLVEYDGCHSGSLEDGLKFYAGWEYIGQGSIYSIGDVRQRGEGVYHFFKRTGPKMEEFITVWYKQGTMSVPNSVAERLKLKDNQHIQTENHFWEILRASASYGISICEHYIQTTDN